MMSTRFYLDPAGTRNGGALSQSPLHSSTPACPCSGVVARGVAGARGFKTDAAKTWLSQPILRNSSRLAPLTISIDFYNWLVF